MIDVRVILIHAVRPFAGAKVDDIGIRSEVGYTKLKTQSVATHERFTSRPFTLQRVFRTRKPRAAGASLARHHSSATSTLELQLCDDCVNKCIA